MSTDIQEYSPDEGNSKEKRESHNEVERRRRNKMAVFINELADFVKNKKVMIRRPERVNVLQCASDLMREYSQKDFKDFFLTKKEFNSVVFEVTNGFVLAIDCTTGIIFRYTQGDQTFMQNEAWIGTNIFNLVHTEDHEVLREQLLPDSKNHFLDLKTGTVRREDSVPQYRDAIRSKRNFKCRIKTSNFGYSIVNCNGYILNNNTEKQPNDQLIVFGKIIPVETNEREHSIQDSFETVLNVNGVITNVTGNLLNDLGYNTDRIVGLNFLKFVHPFDKQKFLNYFQQLLQNKGKEFSTSYRVLGIIGQYAMVHCDGESYINPFTDEIKFIVCKNFRVVDPSVTVQKPADKVIENPVIPNVQVHSPIQEAPVFNEINNCNNQTTLGTQMNTPNYHLHQQFNPNRNYQYQVENQNAMLQKQYFEKLQQQQQQHKLQQQQQNTLRVETDESS
ncbi:PREDICTED: aryl hydrocarbon receptor nuclear translocator homolog [Nicrophorus vespilloides]|uniref:Aryl hydrocarbon receptor nuclear translocator homolog n=1 Tax=Nicrophorus vespilloides TaxID=110193 RepID=A0ABM1M5Q2_NICVS|nr:PREDICTED: aryl hydrocarbon receptor nuclear translocator homolog [Nicrophorus vespilloides]